MPDGITLPLIEYGIGRYLKTGGYEQHSLDSKRITKDLLDQARDNPEAELILDWTGQTSPETHDIMMLIEENWIEHAMKASEGDPDTDHLDDDKDDWEQRALE